MPTSFGEMSSRLGSIKCSRFTASFSFFKLTHTLIFTFFLTTGTIGAHQSVGSVNCWIIPSRSIRRSSSLTFGKSGNGKRLAVVKQYGFVSSFSVIFIGLHLTRLYDPNILVSSTRFIRFIS